jgi:hypothetical protein
MGKDKENSGLDISIYNKYIFSKEKNSGTEYYVFSKPFYFPYKIADLTFMTSENYCFLGAPEVIYDELKGLKPTNIEVENCTNQNATKVCFGSSRSCDIEISGGCFSPECKTEYDKGSVKNKISGEEMNYVGNLMYAAIFSSEDNYNCNIERLFYRATKLTEVLIEKTDLMRIRGCSSDMKGDLTIWKETLSSTAPEDILSISGDINSLEIKNERESCGLW